MQSRMVDTIAAVHLSSALAHLKESSESKQYRQQGLGMSSQPEVRPKINDFRKQKCLKAILKEYSMRYTNRPQCTSAHNALRCRSDPECKQNFYSTRTLRDSSQWNGTIRKPSSLVFYGLLYQFKDESTSPLVQE